MNRALTTIAGVVIGFAVVSYVAETYPTAAAAATAPITQGLQQSPIATSTAVTAAPRTGVAPPAQPAKKIEQGSKPVKVRGVTMPGNCLSLQPELVTYVEQHGDANKPGYVADKDIAAYVCGWY